MSFSWPTIVTLLSLAWSLTVSLADGADRDCRAERFGDLPPEVTFNPTIQCPIVPEKDWGMIGSLAFTADGKALAARSGGKTRFYDPEATITLDDTPKLKTFQDAGFPVTFAPDGRVMAGGANYGVALIDAATGRRVRQLKVAPEVLRLGLLTLAFSPDGKLLVGGFYSGEVVVWEVATGRQAYVLPPFVIPAGKIGRFGREIGARPARMTGLAFSPDGATLYTAGGILRAWNVATGQERFRFDKPLNGFMSCVTVSPDGTVVAAGDEGNIRLTTGERDERNTLTLWDAATGRKWSEMPTCRSIEGVAFLPGGRQLVSLEAHGVICLWDVAAAKRLAAVRFDGHLYAVCMALSPDGKRIAIGGQGSNWIFGVIQLIDTDGVTLTPRLAKP